MANINLRWMGALRGAARFAPSLLIIAAVAACSKPDENRNITIFAASSLQESFQALGDRYKSSRPNIKLTFQFAGSPTLVGQIQSGAPADVFASADEENMKKLSDAKWIDGDALIFAANKLTIAVPKDNAKKISHLKDLERPDLLIGLCAPEVPAGRYAAKILKDQSIQLTPRTLEPNVRALSQKVASGDLDAAIVYITDIRASAGKLASVEIPDAQNVIAKYPIAVVKNSAAPDEARRWIQFVTSSEGAAILQQSGFSKP